MTSRAYAGAWRAAVRPLTTGSCINGIYFIDPEDREQTFMRSSATLQDIVANLAAMLD